MVLYIYIIYFLGISFQVLLSVLFQNPHVGCVPEGGTKKQKLY